MYSGDRGSTCFLLQAICRTWWLGPCTISLLIPHHAINLCVHLRWTEPRTGLVIPDLVACRFGCALLTIRSSLSGVPVLLDSLCCNLGSIFIPPFRFYKTMLKDTRFLSSNATLGLLYLYPLFMLTGLFSECHRNIVGPNVWQWRHSAGAIVAFHARKWPRV